MIRQEEYGGKDGETEDGAQGWGEVQGPSSEVDQEVGEAERGNKSDDPNDNGREVGGLGQRVAWITIALAQCCNVVATVFDCLTMKNFSKNFDNITSYDCGTTELLDDTERKTRACINGKSLKLKLPQ